ncbi:MAG: cytidine deaminase [Armatimonadota bacterium]|nr:cytidine deaminase [Armatimonadota bacterium]MDR7451262.1 cytidine deaminase [Armatimonadota bacterium]MDR7466835.1 cytidine deaminase [Armatimonadota bacterium]MDR7492692.1 cytidine deaminase [Armatimonadota bacterium]MDR7499621.1 cytidine deaminase [Armatimonadota bacterium]
MRVRRRRPRPARRPPSPHDAALVRAAAEARRRAYAPYSRFRVGAAVRTADGAVYTGANIENASYPLAHCAERVAIHKAVSEGHRRIDTVAVVADGPEPAMPCGACRQVMAEFGVRRIVVATPAGVVRVRTLRRLLAEPFLPERLLGKR